MTYMHNLGHPLARTGVAEELHAVTPLTMSAYAPSGAGTRHHVKHRIARRHIERRLPRFAPRTLIVMALGTPIAKPVLRRAYDRYMQTRTHPKYTRGAPTVH